MDGIFLKGYHTAKPLKIVQTTVGEGDLLIEMCVKELKGETVRSQEQELQINGKINNQ